MAVRELSCGSMIPPTAPNSSLTSILAQTGSDPDDLTVYNGALYFAASGNDGTGSELWKYDLVHGADRVADIHPGVSGSYPAYFAVFNGSLYFQANGNDGAGAELWQYGNTSTVSIRSTGSLDGWVLESGETTNAGGTLNASRGTFQLGDDAQDRQYRSILSFDTSSLPDNAVVTVAQDLHPAAGHQPAPIPSPPWADIKVDIRKGAFGTSGALLIGDFQAAASRANSGNHPELTRPGQLVQCQTAGGGIDTSIPRA